DNSDAVSGSRLCLGSSIRQVVPDSFLQESLFVSVRGCFTNNWWLKTTEYEVQGTTLHQNKRGRWNEDDEDSAKCMEDNSDAVFLCLSAF
ncbi:MAG: hypothetical protein ACRCX4_07425, partial [Bacteroidales bacterium]